MIRSNFFKDGMTGEYGLSHFVYSAPILTSCTVGAKSEMASVQRKVLRAIGISEATAAALYNI